MAVLCTIICVQCGYKALVAGGPSTGMVESRQTILCFDCQEVMDVVSGVFKGFQKRHMELTGKSDEYWLKVRIRCEKNAKHRWREWNAPDLCPRCGGPMSQDEHGEQVSQD